MDNDYRAPKGSIEAGLEKAGFSILACDCGSRHWMVIVKGGQTAALRIFCGVCNSFSGEMVPKDEQDRKLLDEAGKELEERRQLDAKEENNWGFEVGSNKGNKLN